VPAGGEQCVGLSVACLRLRWGKRVSGDGCRSRADHSKRPFDTQSPKACSVGCVMCQHMHEEGKVHVGRGGALSGGYPGIKVISARDLGIPWTEAIIVHLSTDGTGLDRAASAS
jgi:hypothetical protein